MKKKIELPQNDSQAGSILPTQNFQEYLDAARRSIFASACITTPQEFLEYIKLIRAEKLAAIIALSDNETTSEAITHIDIDGIEPLGCRVARSKAVELRRQNPQYPSVPEVEKGLDGFENWGIDAEKLDAPAVTVKPDGKIVQRLPLSKTAQKIYDILRALPETQGLTADQIADRLSALPKEESEIHEAGSIRRRHLPQLKPYGLLKTEHGFCIR
jgi:hypothetical protein